MKDTMGAMGPPSEPFDMAKDIQDLEEINSRRFDPKMGFSYDFCKSLIHFIPKDNNLNYKRLAEVLEAGTKVYASKVDLVYKQTRKISTRLALVDSDNKKEKKSNQKKKKEHFLGEYVGKNLIKPESLKTINGKLTKAILHDPLYRKLSAAYDVSDISCLVSRQVLMMPQGHLAINSTDSLTHCDITNESFIHLFDRFPYPLRKSIDLATVHPAMREFDFNDRSVDMEELIERYAQLLREKEEYDTEDLEMSFRIADKVYDFHQDIDDLMARTMAEYETPLEDLPEDTARQQMVDNVPGFDNDDYDDHYDPGIFDELAESENAQNTSVASHNESRNHTETPSENHSRNHSESSSSVSKVSRSGLAERANFMSRIFNQQNFFDKNFLKKIHSKRFPHDRPRALYDETPSEMSQDLPETRRPERKKTVKPKFEPLALRFVFERPKMSKDVMKMPFWKKQVEKVNKQHAQVRQKFGFTREDLYRSFFKPSHTFDPFSRNNLFSPRTTIEKIEPEEEANDTQMNLDDDYDDDFQVPQDHSPADTSIFNQSANTSIFNRSANSSVDGRKRLLSQTSGYTTCSVAKTPRYIADFGNDLDPHGLGDQNPALVTHLEDESLTKEEKMKHFTTRMKKINFKRLKKIMYSFVEKYSWENSRLQEYLKQKTPATTNDCLTFYKLIALVIYQGNLDQRTMDDLSVPIFFNASLHMCNDKRLIFTKKPDGNGDFYISSLGPETD